MRCRALSSAFLWIIALCLSIWVFWLLPAVFARSDTPNQSLAYPYPEPGGDISLFVPFAISSGAAQR